MKMTLAQLKKAAPLWFDKGAMAFFNTKIVSQPDRFGMFITSDAPTEDAERRYSLRIWAPGRKNVETIGEFWKDSLETILERQRALRRAFNEAGNREKYVLENLYYVHISDLADGCYEFQAHNWEIGSYFTVDVNRKINLIVQ